MRRAPAVLAFLCTSVAAPMTAQACVVRVPFQVEQVRHADVVVIGRVSDYRRTVSDRQRQWIAESAKRDPGAAPERARPDRASFDLTVERIAAGQPPPRRVRVEWDPSTYGVPEAIPEGRYLVALRRMRDVTASGARYRVLRGGCSTPFMFESGDREAVAVLRVLAGEPPYPPDPPEPQRPAWDQPPPPAPAPPPFMPYAEHRETRPLWNELPVLYRLMLGGAGVVVAAAAVALLWRRRRPTTGDHRPD